MSPGIVIDTSQPRLEILRDYQELPFRYLWEKNSDGANAKEFWDYVNEKLGEDRSVSRASATLSTFPSGFRGISSLRYS